MKQLSITLAALAVAAQSFGVGFVPFAPGHPVPERQKRHAKAPQKASSAMLLDEDFSRFSQGSAENPVAISLDGYYLPDDLTNQPGWEGLSVYEAGGACAIMMYEDEYYGPTSGFLSTPQMNLYGDVTLTFRAKVINADSGSMWVPLCDYYDGPMDDFDVVLSDEWQTFEFSSDKAPNYDESYFQFTPNYCDVLIDDVKIELKRNKIEAPYALPAINHSLTEFTASWESSYIPEKYIFNVYSKEKPTNYEKGEVTETFDAIRLLPGTNTIDAADPNYPAGWEIAIRNPDGNDVYTDPQDYFSAPISMRLSEPGSSITSIETPDPITGVTFWVKPSNMETEYYEISLLQVSVYNGVWSPIANLPNYWMNEDGGFYSFNSDVIGEGVTNIRFEYIQKGSADVAFAIDNVTMEYATADLRVPYVEDMEIDGNENSMLVEGIAPEGNYFYYVQAVDGDLISPESRHVWVDGIIGITPEALPASDVSTTGFTANWTALPHADGYNVSVSRLTHADEDMIDVTVIEETFDKIDYGTLENPGYDWTSPFNFGEAGMADGNWLATQPRWIVGMAGSQGTSWYGSAGLVVSPRLTLSNGGGAFDVEFTALSTVADDAMFCMILNDINDSQALEAHMLEMDAEPGLKSGTVHFGESAENRTDVLIAFMSRSGQMFFIDDVLISQDLLKGESLVSQFDEVDCAGDSFTFSGLPEGSDYAYSVTAYANKEFTDYVSERSNTIKVDNIATSVASIGHDGVFWRFSEGTLTVSTADGNADISLYDLQGNLLHHSAGTSGELSIKVASGLHILKIGEKAFKVML